MKSSDVIINQSRGSDVYVAILKFGGEAGKQVIRPAKHSFSFTYA